MKLTLKRGADWYFLINDQDDWPIEVFCPTDFEHITGIKLKRGESRNVKSIKITFEPVKKKKVKK